MVDQRGAGVPARGQDPGGRDRLPGELWQIWAAHGELHEQREEPEVAHDTFSRATQIVERFAGEIEDEILNKGFLSAPQLRRVLEPPPAKRNNGRDSRSSSADPGWFALPDPLPVTLPVTPPLRWRTTVGSMNKRAHERRRRRE